MTSSPPGCAERTSMSGGPTSGSRSWSRAPRSTELGRKSGGGRRQGGARRLLIRARARLPCLKQARGLSHVRTDPRRGTNQDDRRHRAAGIGGALATAGSAGATSSPTRSMRTTRAGSRQDNGAHISSAGFQPSGGNPGGHLTAKDTGTEDDDAQTTSCDLLTFYSPFVPSWARTTAAPPPSICAPASTLCSGRAAAPPDGTQLPGRPDSGEAPDTTYTTSPSR